MDWPDVPAEPPDVSLALPQATLELPHPTFKPSHVTSGSPRLLLAGPPLPFGLPLQRLVGDFANRPVVVVRTECLSCLRPKANARPDVFL
jgi:hypothetical protein